MTQKTPGDGGTSTKAPEAPAAAEAVTRADLDLFRKDLLTEIGALVARSATPADPATPPADSDPAPAAETLTRADVEKTIGDAVKPLADAVEKLSGLTVVRSEGDMTAAKPNAKNNAKRGDDVFRGAFFGNPKAAE